LSDSFNSEDLSELYALSREYEAVLQTTSDPEMQRRLRHILQDIRSCIINSENDAKSA
jgi:hypothetical protein